MQTAISKRTFNEHSRNGSSSGPGFNEGESSSYKRYPYQRIVLTVPGSGHQRRGTTIVKKRNRNWTPRLLTVLLGLSLFLGGALAGKAQGTGLESVIPGDVVASGTNLSIILQIIQEDSGIPFVLDAGADKPVTFALQNPTVREILETVLPSNQLDYIENENGGIRVGNMAVIGPMKQDAPVLINRTFRPENVDVSEILPALEAAKSENGRIIIDPRNNQISVRDTPDAIADMQEILFTLDQERESRVFEVNFGDIMQITDQLRAALQLEDADMIVDERSGKLILRAPIDILNRAEAIIEQLDMETEIRVFPLAFPDFELIDAIIDQLTPMLSENGRVELDERTMRLIVEDTPARLDRIAKLIKLLDISPLQVYLEVEIVSISDGHESEFDFSTTIGDAVGTSDESVGSATGGAGSFPLSYNPFLTTGSSGMQLFHVSTGEFRLELTAMVSESKAEVIASPRILVQDDYQCFFNLGSEEPYSVQQNYGGYGGGYNSGYNNAYGSGYGSQYSQRNRDVGTILDIIPHISEAGYVDMEIMVEDSSPRREDIGNGQVGLAVDKTEIETRVTVKAGRTVVLGGLVRRNTSNSRSGVPILSKIPILGAAFRQTAIEDKRDKMLIFITPILVNVDDPYDFANVTSIQEIERLREGTQDALGQATINPRFTDWTNEKDNEVDVLFERDPRKDEDKVKLVPPTGTDEPVSGSKPQYKVIGDESEAEAPEVPAEESK